MTAARSPLTGSPDVTLLETIPAGLLRDEWDKLYGIDVSGETSGLESVFLYRCNETGLRFFHPPGVAGSERFYDRLHARDWYEMEGKWEHREALRALSGRGRVLEIGAGSGVFIRAAVAAGLSARGIELSPSAVAAARGKGLPVERLGVAEAAERFAGTLDAVCSFQVLEHAADPAEFIRCSVRLLRPGGIWIVSVPNAESFLKLGHFLLDMPPHHMLRWSEESLRAIQRHFPLALERIREEPLAACHVETYLSSWSDRLRSGHSWGRLGFNRLTIPLYRALLRLGARRVLRGMSLYAEFRRS